MLDYELISRSVTATQQAIYDFIKNNIGDYCFYDSIPADVDIPLDGVAVALRFNSYSEDRELRTLGGILNQRYNVFFDMALYACGSQSVVYHHNSLNSMLTKGDFWIPHPNDSSRRYKGIIRDVTFRRSSEFSSFTRGLDVFSRTTSYTCSIPVFE